MPPGQIVPVLVTPPLKVAAKDGRIWPLESHWIAPVFLSGRHFAAPTEVSQNYAPGISLIKATGFVLGRVPRVSEPRSDINSAAGQG